MSTKKKPQATATETKKPETKKVPTLAETAVAIVSKLSQAVIKKDGEAVKDCNQQLSEILEKLNAEKQKCAESIHQCKVEQMKLTIKVVGECQRMQNLEKLEAHLKNATGSLATLGELDHDTTA